MCFTYFHLCPCCLQPNMDVVNVVELVVGKLVDVSYLLVDLLLGSLSHLLLLLSTTLPSPGGHTLVEYWNFSVFFLLSTTKSVAAALYGSLRAAEGRLPAMEGVFESFKMVGHLVRHVAWRSKDVLQRRLISSSCVLQHMWDHFHSGLLMGVQNCASVLVCAWQALAAPLNAALQLLLTLLTFLYSCVLGVSMLLWMPCQLLVDLFRTLSRVFFSVCTADTYLLFLTLVIVVALQLLKCCFAVLTARLLSIVQGEPRAQTVPIHSSASRRADALGLRPRNRRHASQEELLILLKEQEERKKCVICQDQSKTVLLLPCRHLCLCRCCADRLNHRRDVQQHCCPLCRQPITQSMDVFL